MAREGGPVHDSGRQEHVFIARCAFFLFIAGLLVPFLIATVVLATSGRHGYAEVPATLLPLGFAFVAETLALGLGVIGRQRLSGRIATLGAITTFVMALVIVGGVILALRFGGHQAWFQGGPR